MGVAEVWSLEEAVAVLECWTVEPKTLWRLARLREARSMSAWVSASRDSEAANVSFRTWLNSLPVDSSVSCFIIAGPHQVTATNWSDALNWLFSAIPEAGQVFIFGGDLETVLTLDRIGVARFTSATKPEARSSLIQGDTLPSYPLLDSAGR